MAADPPPPAVPPPRPRRRRGPALLLVLALALLPSALGAALWWSLSPAGLAWWLPRTGVQVSGLRGGLLGGALAFDALRWQGSDGARLEIDAFSLDELRWAWARGNGLSLRLQAPRATRVAWRSGATDATPLAAPQSLHLPLRLRVQALRIDALEVDALPPLRDVQLTAELGAQSGSVHRLESLALQWQQFQLQARGQLGTRAPLALQGQAQASSLAGVQPPWQAQLTLGGTLAQLELSAALRSGATAAGAAAPAGTPASASLDAQARLAPFADWPLQALQLRTQGLDLAALAPALPATTLTGHADLQGGAAGTPLQLDLMLDNARPGRWTQGRLPLRSAQLTLGARPQRRDVLELQALALELGDAQGRAGSLSGSGRWESDQLTLELRAQSLQPARLDARLPALRLDGPLRLALQGFNLPGSTAATPAALQAHLEADLRGRQDERGPVQLQTALQARREGAAGARHWTLEVQQLSARAGGAQAQARGQVQIQPDGAWQAHSRGQLQGFDPAAWWPGAPAASVLDGDWDAQLSAAAGAPLPQALRGQAALALQGRLAAVPLQGKLSWRDTGAGLQAQARLQLGGNRIDLDGRAATAAAAPQWTLAVDAPALAALAPLRELHPALPALWPREGRLSAEARLQVRSPQDWRGQGRLETSALALGPWRLAQAQARWDLQAPGTGNAPLTLALEAAGLQQDGTARLERLRAQVQGRWSEHRIELDATSPLRLPAWTDDLIGPARGTELTLRGNGAWQGGAAGRWVLQLQTLQARALGGRATPWLSTAPLQARLDFDPALRSVAVSPGSMELLGLALRWSQLDWSAPATPEALPRLRAQAELQALRVAPWLQRLQPDFGWGGDLEVGGRLRFDSADAQGSEIVVERLRGDLQRSDEVGGVQDFGLSELRLALQVQDGRWTFTQAMAARHFGVLAGAQVIQSRPRAPWPAPEDPMQGVLELRVDDLGVWAPWVPAGWRLGGRLHAMATLGGRFRAPELTGRLEASRLALRNLLQGVDLRDGEVAMALRGEDARIERFTLLAGDGRLEASGGAQFGASPRAALQLKLERFRVLGRFDRQLSVSGQAALALQAQRLELDGRLAVDEGFIDISRSEAPALDEDVTVLHRPSAPTQPPAPPEPSALMRNARVDLRLDLGSRLRLRGQGLDTRLGGELALSTPGGRPEVRGTVRTLQGRYAAYGQDLEIERGEIVFTGALLNPRLDILAIRPKLDEVRVGVQIVGTAQNPRVRLYSEPELAETEKLSWLVTGRAPDTLGRADTALLQRAALALLAGQDGGATPGRQLWRSLGLDEVALSQRSSGEVQQTVVSLGRQLSQRWYLGYERGIGSTLGTWQLIYRLGRRLTLRGQSGEQTSVDVLWSWRWN